MKWLTVLGASGIGFAGLFAVIEGRMEGAATPAESARAESAAAESAGAESAVPGATAEVEARVLTVPGENAAEMQGEGTLTALRAGPVPVETEQGAEFEARLELEVIAPLRERRDRSLRSRFSRAAVSRGAFDHTRVQVPERLRELAGAAIALEIGAAWHLLPVRLGASDRPVEIRVGDAWHAARDYLSDPRCDLSALERLPTPLPRIARSGRSFEAVVSAQLIEPLEARRLREMQGVFSRSERTPTSPFEFTRLGEIPEPWANRSDGVVRIEPWGGGEPQLVPFRLETVGGMLEVHADGVWQGAAGWMAGTSSARRAALVPTPKR